MLHRDITHARGCHEKPHSGGQEDPQHACPREAGGEALWQSLQDADPGIWGGGLHKSPPKKVSGQLKRAAWPRREQSNSPSSLRASKQPAEVSSSSPAAPPPHLPEVAALKRDPTQTPALAPALALSSRLSSIAPCNGSLAPFILFSPDSLCLQTSLLWIFNCTVFFNHAGPVAMMQKKEKPTPPRKKKTPPKNTDTPLEADFGTDWGARPCLKKRRKNSGPPPSSSSPPPPRKQEIKWGGVPFVFPYLPNMF